MSVFFLMREESARWQNPSMAIDLPADGLDGVEGHKQGQCDVVGVHEPLERLDGKGVRGDLLHGASGAL